MHLTTVLRYAIDEPHAGTDQGQQVRPGEPAPPSLRHLQQLVGHEQFVRLVGRIPDFPEQCSVKAKMDCEAGGG